MNNCGGVSLVERNAPFFIKYPNKNEAFQPNGEKQPQLFIIHYSFFIKERAVAKATALKKTN